MKILLCVLGVLLLCVLAAVIYISSTPMPVVRMLRKGLAEQLSVPENYEAVKNTVKLEKDITFSSACGRNQFDLYLPKEAGKPLPLILWVHGGAFVAGDKCGVENWGYMLAGNGFAVAVMNYEWAPEAAYPAQVIQIKECLLKLQAMAEEGYPLDINQVVLAGDSAGAHMAAQFAALHSNKDLSQKINVSSPMGEDALKGVLLYCGPYDLKLMMNPKNRVLKFFISRIGWSYFGKKRWSKSPLAQTVTVSDFVTSAYPPAYITDGNNMSFEGHGRALLKKLEENGVQTKERFFDPEQGEVNHEYQMELANENAMLCFQDTLEFLETVIKK